MSSTEPKKKHAGGRPPKINPEIIKEITLAIKAGAYMETAASFAGISKDTLYEWLRKGKKQSSGLYRQFSDAVEKALAEGEFRDVLVIDRAANGTKAEYLVDKNGNTVKDSEGNPILVRPAMKPEWTAAAWRLERKFPKRWGRKDRLELADAPPTDPIDAMTSEERQAKIDEIIARRKARSGEE